MALLMLFPAEGDRHTRSGFKLGSTHWLHSCDHELIVFFFLFPPTYAVRMRNGRKACHNCIKVRKTLHCVCQIPPHVK